MKKLLILGSAVLISCTSLKKIDTTGFYSSENVIMYEKDTVATLSAIEYSIDDGKYVKEMTFKLVDMNHAKLKTYFILFINNIRIGRLNWIIL